MKNLEIAKARELVWDKIRQMPDSLEIEIAFERFLALLDENKSIEH